MKQAYFITGTDTDVGKTFVAQSLLHFFNKQGIATSALKPVAAGCEMEDGQWKNSDALALMSAMSQTLLYSQVNPIALPEAIAPHLAAEHTGVSLSVADLHKHCAACLQEWPGVTLVEGAGGWRVPLNNDETLADLATALDLPVILVVGIRLGCISHALLTAEAIVADGLPIAGWVANMLGEENQVTKENIATIESRLDAPLLGKIPFYSDLSPQSAESAASHLKSAQLLIS